MKYVLHGRQIGNTSLVHEFLNERARFLPDFFLARERFVFMLKV
jgi:hypothetical protein